MICCRTCKTDKPAGASSPAYRDPKIARCRECRASYYIRNAEALKAASMEQYYRRKSEPDFLAQRAAASKRWYYRNREKARQYYRDYYARHRTDRAWLDHRNAMRRAWEARRKREAK